jgi:2-deoxy-D-gluconate 3-dehydrogenase
MKEDVKMGILDLFRLDGKVALVTGVGRGLGQAMTVGLAEAGADIAGLYLSRYEETQGRVEALGRRFLPVQCDLREATVARLNEVVDHVVGEMGRLDVLVNNAGIIRRAPMLEFSEQDWDDVIQVNLKALFFLSQAAARVMARQGAGKIIHIASMLSFQGGILIPPYTAAKSGVAGLTRAMANEWAAKGINVNAIAPGYMATDNTAPLRADPQRNQAILARIPAGQWGDPADLQGAIVFLASAAANYMHGAIVPVDGGWLAR